MHGDVLAGGIDDDNSVRDLAHVTDAAQVALKLDALAVEAGKLLLGHELDLRLVVDVFKVVETGDAFLDRLHVGERAAQPAMIDVELAAGFGGLFHSFLRLTFAANEEDFFAFAGEV